MPSSFIPLLSYIAAKQPSSLTTNGQLHADITIRSRVGDERRLLFLCVCVCVCGVSESLCVCVCERERERERERECVCVCTRACMLQMVGLVLLIL